MVVTVGPENGSPALVPYLGEGEGRSYSEVSSEEGQGVKMKTLLNAIENKARNEAVASMERAFRKIWKILHEVFPGKGPDVKRAFLGELAKGRINPNQLKAEVFNECVAIHNEIISKEILQMRERINEILQAEQERGLD